MWLAWTARLMVVAAHIGGGQAPSPPSSPSSPISSSPRPTGGIRMVVHVVAEDALNAAVDALLQTVQERAAGKKLRLDAVRATCRKRGLRDVVVLEGAGEEPAGRRSTSSGGGRWSRAGTSRPPGPPWTSASGPSSSSR
jgi:hypothetical protein